MRHEHGKPQHTCRPRYTLSKQSASLRDAYLTIDRARLFTSRKHPSQRPKSNLCFVSSAIILVVLGNLLGSSEWVPSPFMFNKITTNTKTTTPTTGLMGTTSANQHEQTKQTQQKKRSGAARVSRIQSAVPKRYRLSG